VNAIRLHLLGGPEVLKYEDVPEPTPKKGEALVRVEAAGVNFIDIYQRIGVYKLALPLTLGMEGAGTVAAVGESVTDVKVGDRVAWTSVQGAYAQYCAVPADRLVALPPGVTTKQGAAMMLQGMTAHYLACSTYALTPVDTCLVHAGAGGVGLLLTQVAKLRGARVVTTVSTPEKAALSRGAGADCVILYSEQDFEPEVKAFSGGQGVQVVYDSVGQTTFAKSINCLATRGTLVHYIATRAELSQRATDLFGWIQSGKMRLRTEFEFPLKDAAEAHKALAGRKTTGKVLLIPDAS
jgi:NADPH:quinone reductase